MHLYINTTSPFVRLVRLAIAEKGLEDRVQTEIVDPWADPKDFLDANPAGRVPVLITDDGVPIAEASLILRYLEQIAPEPKIWPEDDLDRTLSFDTDMVGAKRYRTMADGLARLDANPPRDFADRPDIANMAAVTAVDYIVFRFPDRDWLADLPTLKAWRERQQDRHSVKSTQPYV